MLDLLRFVNEDSKCIISRNGSEISYSQFNQVAYSFSKHLEHRSLCILVCNSSIECLAFYVQALRSGSALLPLDRSVSPEYLQALINRFQPSLIVGEITNEQVGENIHLHRISQNFSIAHTHFSATDIHRDLALLLTTSGSTSNPKLVKLSYQNLLANTKSICNYLDINSNDRHITTLPMNYTYGLSCLNTHLWSGSSIILTDDSVITREFWETVSVCKPSTISCVPFTYELIRKAKLMEALAQSSIKKITQAGGRMSTEIKRELLDICDRNQKQLFIMYGQTEATARISYVPPHALPSKLESIGLPIPSGSLFIKEKDSVVTSEANLEGEIIYKGPNIFKGYASMKDDLKSLDNLEYLETGDIGYKDDDGFFYITSRKSNFAKISGKRISLADIDNYLESRDIFSASISDDIKIRVYIDSGLSNLKFDSDLQEIKRTIQDRVGVHPTALVVTLIDSLPRLSNGKIDKKSLKNHGN